MERRNRWIDATHMWGEVTALQNAKSALNRRLQSRENVPQRDTTLTLLVPGALSGDKELQPTRDFLKRMGGLENVEAVNPLPKDKVMEQVKDLVEKIKRYNTPLRLVGFSLGGSVALLAAQECLRQGLPIERVITVDAPIVPVDKTHFNYWATENTVNDLLDNKEFNTQIAKPIPPELHLISLYVPNDGFMHPDASHRPEAKTSALPTRWHLSLYYDEDVLKEISRVCTQ